MTRRSTLYAPLAAALLTLTTAGHAAPRPGQPFPEFSTNDLSGRRHSSRELVGRRTLVLVIPSPDAERAMRAWNTEVLRRMPRGVHRLSLIALRLPGIIPTGIVRDRARAEIPQQHWQDTWLDRDGALRQTLGLGDGALPYVFVLGPDGTVLASVHSPVTDARAQDVWAALSR